VIISACLLGENCRYDGKTKKSNEIVEHFKEYEIIPFCPEAPLFGTPRQRISVVQIEGENRIITDETNEDVTEQLQNEIERFLLLHQDVTEVVLKSKSPSCGVGTTPIYNKKREFLKFGNGVATDIFFKIDQSYQIRDETQI